MRPFTARFHASLRSSHLVATLCELYFPGTTTPVVVPIEAGAVTIDRTAQVRRTGHVVIPWSLEAGDDLGLDLRTLPLGGYCRLYRGLRYADRTVELILLGTLRVESVTWKTTAGTASLELADRMAQVRDEPFLAPYAPVGVTGISRAATLTDDSPIVAVSPTSDLLVGMAVSAPGVRAGSRIVSITPSSITLSAPVNIAAFKTSTVTAGSPFLTSIGDTSDLFVGMHIGVSGTSDILPGSVIAAIASPTSIQMNQNAVGSGVHDVTFDLSPAQTLSFGGAVRVADAAISVVQAVFGATIGYSKLLDPLIVLIDVAYTGSRADAVQALALAAGGEAYFDALGNFIFDRPAGDTDPVWTIDAGHDGVLVDADESLNRTGVFNGVLVEGQNSATDAPVSALVTDNTPGSPTLWGGPFGKVARIETSSVVQTTQQAQDAATAIFNRRLTLQRALTVTEAPNPALEAGDVVTVRFVDGRVETHVINAVQTDLGPQAAQALTLQASYGQLAAGALSQPARRYGVYYGREAWRQLDDATVAV